eukprot:3951437-Amphidinium_carterae.1
MYIASFVDAKAKVRTLGSQPPTRTYRSLCVLGSFVGVENELCEVMTKEEISQVGDAWKTKKEALLELLAMA